MEVRLYQGLIEFNWNLLFSAITVLVLYLILKHFFFEKVHDFMMSRKLHVEDELAHADNENKKAEELLKEYSQALAGAEEEKRQIIKEAKATADERSDEIVSEAKEQAATILADAHKKIEIEEQKTVKQLKKEIASIAVLTAGQIMEKDLSKDDQEELINKVLKEAADGKWQNQ